MKQYLWVGMAVLCVSANASLKEDFVQTDREQAVFLNSLKKSTASEGLVKGGEIEDDLFGSPDPVVSEEEQAQEDKAAAIRKKAMDEASKKSETALIQEEKEEMLKQISAKTEELNKAKEQARIEKEQREMEQREVAAYEKKRAEKLAEEAQEKAELEQKLLEEQALEKEAEQKEVSKEEPVKDNIVDIDIAREAQEAKDAADIAYWEAVQEMRKAD